MTSRVLILGAGFGGLELATTLSEELGDDIDVTLIDRSASFSFGYAKLDVMFGRQTFAETRLPYADIEKPGLRFLQQTVVAIDAAARSVTTDTGVHEADFLVIALGADYDYDATPGLVDGANEFYSFEGAARLAEVIPTFTKGHAIIGVCGAPFKCPPAPSECALLLHDDLVARGVRDHCQISVVMPFSRLVPPSPETSAALLDAFSERDIAFIPDRRVSSIDPTRGIAVLDELTELPFDLFLGVPKHRAPDVVLESGLAVDGYIPVDHETLATEVSGVYAVGDVTTVGVPKAGVFAERAARVVAAAIVASVRGGEPPEPYDGRGSCYIEFGRGLVGRVDVDFYSGPKPTGVFNEPSDALVREKETFGSSRRARWFRS